MNNDNDRDKITVLKDNKFMQVEPNHKESFFGKKPILVILAGLFLAVAVLAVFFTIRSFQTSDVKLPVQQPQITNQLPKPQKAVDSLNAQRDELKALPPEQPAR